MKAFPNAWGHIKESVATPVGQPCAACQAPIQDSDVGVVMPHLDTTTVTARPWHRRCLLAAIGIDVGNA